MTNVPFATFLSEQTPLVQMQPTDGTLRVNRAGADLLIKQLRAVGRSGEEEVCVAHDGESPRPLVIAPAICDELAAV